jgi:SAM-dependent methyltransferase
MKDLFRREGHKAVYKQFRPHVKRTYSRSLIQNFAPTGQGLELGVGSQSIAPRSRTLLSDAFDHHGQDKTSLAQKFFSVYSIPYPNETFSFVLSEHMFEHLSNPLKALRESIRVLKGGGHIFLFLPHPQRTFDKLRPRTTLDHLIEDEKMSRDENDETHFDEWQTLVMDQDLAPHYQHIPRDQWNDEAAIHHHVWLPEDIQAIFEHLGLKVVHCENEIPDRSDTFVVIGQKT